MVSSTFLRGDTKSRNARGFSGISHIRPRASRIGHRAACPGRNCAVAATLKGGSTGGPLMSPMSVARKAGLLAGVVGVAALLAGTTQADDGEGHHHRRKGPPY